MSKLDALQVFLVAGEGFAAATLAMAMAWLGASGRSASRRHLVWLAGFGALLLLPLLAIVAPPAFHMAVFHISIAAAPLPPQAVDLIPVAEAPHDQALTFDAAMLAKAAIGLWLTGVFVVAVRALFAGIALLRLKAQSTPHRFGHLPIVGPRASLRIADGDGGCGPVTWGLWRAVILLPREAVTWPRERLDAVLRHELAHVERRDCLTQTLALIACALYWPHPLVWFGARRLRREAEMAADDAVLVSGIRPSTYASALLRIANDFRVHAHMPLAMAAPSALEARVQSVLAASQPRTGVTSRDAIRIAGVGFAAAAALAFARPSLAEDVTTAPLGAVAADSAAAAPGVPAAASVPATAPVPPRPPVASVAPREPQAPHRTVLEITDDATGMHVTRRPLTAEEQKHIRDAVRQARSAVEAARPAMDRAVREAHMARAVMLRLKADEPKIKIAVAEAERVSSDEIHRALAEARAAVGREHLDEKALAQVQHALDQVEANMTEDHGDVQIVVPEEPDGDDDAEVKTK